MRLKFIQLRAPDVDCKGNVRVPFLSTKVVNAETGEALKGVQSIQISVDHRGTTATITLMNPDVEFREMMFNEVEWEPAAPVCPKPKASWWSRLRDWWAR